MITVINSIHIYSPLL